MNSSIQPVAPATAAARGRESQSSKVEATPRKPEPARDAIGNRPDETEATIDAEKVESVIEQHGRRIQFGERHIEFSYNRDITRVVVRVVSAESEEVIRQIPPEEFVKFAARYREQLGILFDETA